MRTVVLERNVVEEDVKPRPLLEEYRRLLEADVGELAKTDLAPSACPGCRGSAAQEAFARFGMQYLCCSDCQSLYVSPRPSADALTAFYRNAGSAVFWRDIFLPETGETRRSKLVRPRVQWLLDAIDEYHPDSRSAISIGYDNNLLIEELRAQESSLFDITVANAVADMEFADAIPSGIAVQPTTGADLGDLDAKDIVLAFDVIDRSADPDRLFAQAQQLLPPGGLLLTTTILGSGFDVQVLWEMADVYPPERLNLFSVEGLTALYERHGFEALEFSTPGAFDVESVLRKMQTDPEGDLPRLITYLIKNRGEEAREALQEYLQRFRLSSFGRIALRKIE